MAFVLFSFTYLCMKICIVTVILGLKNSKSYAKKICFRTGILDQKIGVFLRTSQTNLINFFWLLSTVFFFQVHPLRL
jgi:hypothetical protein